MLDELPYGNFIEIEGELETLRPIAKELQLIGIRQFQIVITRYLSVYASLVA